LNATAQTFHDVSLDLGSAAHLVSTALQHADAEEQYQSLDFAHADAIGAERMLQQVLLLKPAHGQEWAELREALLEAEHELAEVKSKLAGGRSIEENYTRLCEIVTLFTALSKAGPEQVVLGRHPKIVWDKEALQRGVDTARAFLTR
jgi:hypothetical protein